MSRLTRGAVLGWVVACLLSVGGWAAGGDLFYTREYVAFGRLQQVDAQGITITEGCGEGQKVVKLEWATVKYVSFASLCDQPRGAAPPYAEPTKKPCPGKEVELYSLFTWPGGNRPQYRAYATEVRLQGQALRASLANNKGNVTIDRTELERSRFALRRGPVCDTDVTDPVLPPGVMK